MSCYTIQYPRQGTEKCRGVKVKIIALSWHNIPHQDTDSEDSLFFLTLPQELFVEGSCRGDCQYVKGTLLTTGHLHMFCIRVFEEYLLTEHLNDGPLAVDQVRAIESQITQLYVILSQPYSAIIKKKYKGITCAAGNSDKRGSNLVIPGGTTNYT